MAHIDATVTAICTDTRKIEPGCLFIAIKGDNFDGHDFCAKALELGAVAVLCEKDCGLGDREIDVESTRQALLDIAGWYRSLFNIPVVGVTGSVGKTTTKEMTAQVLSAKYKVIKNEGNLNNEIGVPLTLFRLDDSFEAAVIEMGMSGRGEISRMTKAVAPTVAIINNIGVSHIEKLGSRENILAAKLEIFEGMSKDATVILNGDNDLLSQVRLPGRKVVFFGINNPEVSVRATDIKFRYNTGSFTMDYYGEKVSVELPVRGEHHVLNAMAATAAGAELGISPAEAAEMLKLYENTGMRQRIRDAGGITVIEDCYNASPDSMRASLSVLGEMECKRKIAVLGDMLELGNISEEAHAGIGGFCASVNADCLFAYGPFSRFMAEAAEKAGVKKVFWSDDKSELISSFLSFVQEGDAILFKGSRGMKMEEIMYALYAKTGTEV